MASSCTISLHIRVQPLRRGLPSRHLGVHQGDLLGDVLLLGDVTQSISEATTGRHVGTASENDYLTYSNKRIA